MTLLRLWGLASHKKNIHQGPVPGGVFFCHRDYHDFNPYVHGSLGVSFADLSFLLKTGRVWMQDAERPQDHLSWQEITSPADLPKFRKIDCSNYDHVAEAIVPFLPEFYYVPKNFRGRRFLRRSENRADRRDFGPWALRRKERG